MDDLNLFIILALSVIALIGFLGKLKLSNTLNSAEKLLILLDVAREAVLAAEQIQGDNNAKKEFAIKAIKAALKNLEVQFDEAAIESAIESHVFRLKRDPSDIKRR